MNNDDIKDPIFREAVEAIDTGNIVVLESLLTKHPRLLREPLDRPSGDYFQHPYLLWFIADNPIRNNVLPANIVDITRLLVRFVKQAAPSSMQHQLGYTLGLVATGRIPRECGVQIALIDLLIDEGAQPGGGMGALAHGNKDAAAHLIKRGGTLTLATAVGLDRISDVERLIQDAGDNEKLVALTMAAFDGNTRMLSFLLSKGVDPNGYPANNNGFHSHATPLHQAVYSGSPEAVKLLVEAGAQLNVPDKIYGGTPLGWAKHMQTEEGYDETAKQRFAQIETYLEGLLSPPM
jgi:hypothetical protein